jgi:hypothetical protein
MSVPSVWHPSALGVAVAMLFTARAPNMVTDHFDTLAEARADGLFERGWLPDILPDSTTTIRTSNDLDLNHSTGRFRVGPADMDTFASHSTPGAPSRSPLRGWDSVVAGYADAGLLPRTCHRDGGTWVFFCRATTGECQYVSW